MCESLFRGKRLNNGNWIQGNLVTSAYQHDRAWIIESISFIDKQISEIRACEVDFSSVGKYTGLTDRNGAKIFEGDILKEINLDVESPITIFIRWNKEEIRFEACYTYNPSYICGEPFMDVDAAVFEVIGNIHDNPELASSIE